MKIRNLKKWRENVLNQNKTIRDAIKIINKTGKKIIIVSDKNNHLIGTVTDGDIRRILNKKYFLDHKLKDICNKKPIISKVGDSQDFIVDLFLKNKINYIPVVKKNFLKNIKEIYSEQIKFKKNLFVIPAGGFGKRLYPLTKKIPKPMLKIENKPILEHVIINARKNGFKNIIILTHYLSKKIENYFKNGEKWNVKINYIKEKHPLGTIGGLRLIKERRKLPVVVSNSDLISNINLENMLKFHNKNNAYLTIATRVFESKNRFGVLKVLKNNRVIGFKEKPINLYHVNSGLYIFSREALNLLSKLNLKKIDITNFCKKSLLKKKRVLSYKFYDTWRDIGVFSEF